MVENLAQATANQIVDKVVSADPGKMESAYALLADKLQSEVYGSGGSSQAGSKFIAEVFKDIDAQYTDAKSVPEDLAIAWAGKQLGHELPASGFSLSDLQGIQSSGDSSVTALDKYFAGVLVRNYSELQEQSQMSAADRVIDVHSCQQLKSDLAADNKQFGGSFDVSIPQCNDQFAPGDRERAAGVIREIPLIDIQNRLKSLDAGRPMQIY